MSRGALVSEAFVYLAARPEGGRTWGVRQARNEHALAAGLRRERMLLLRAWRLPGWATPRRGFNLKDQAQFNQQLAQLLTRGVPLVEALEVTEQTVGPRSAPLVGAMRELVSSGSSLGEACRTTGAFDDVTIAVYRAAERTGDLGGAAGQLATTLRRQLAVRGKAATLMIYPAIVFVVASLVSIVLLTFLVPKIAESLEEAGAKMPLFSRMVVALGEAMRDNAVGIVLVLGALLVLGVILRRQVAAGIGLLMRRLPLMRDLVLAQESTRFFSTMAAMTRSGVPLADALGVANGAIGHPALKEQLTTLRTRLIEGGVLRMLIDSVAALPIGTRRLLIAAERSGDLESAFEALASDMAELVEQRADRLLAVLEPALIVMLVVMVGSVILAIMIPMMTMATAVE